MQAIVAVIMGSRTDWEVMKEACLVLDELGIGYEKSLVSAHRTPDWLFSFAESAAGRGIKVIIAGAGGAAHLPGMVAAKTILPVIGVPIPAIHLQGLDSLLSIVQMPAGVPVATVAIGTPGAKNAALLAAQILALEDESLKHKLVLRREESAGQVLKGGTQLF
ncbi:MAG: 5-(carboxyamino)imidazole ribonucleotide mutase [Bacillota bacterium]